MMLRLAPYVTESAELDRTGVALLNAPTFADKAAILSRSLRDELSNTTSLALNLNFIVGWDTLIRIFNPKYYDDSTAQMNEILQTFFERDGARLLCARRGGVKVDEEERFMGSDDVRPYKDKGWIRLFNLPNDEVANLSSTEVRKRVAEAAATSQEGDAWRTRVQERLEGVCTKEIIDYLLEGKLYQIP